MWRILSVLKANAQHVHNWMDVLPDLSFVVASVNGRMQELCMGTSASVVGEEKALSGLMGF